MRCQDSCHHDQTAQRQRMELHCRRLRRSRPSLLLRRVATSTAMSATATRRRGRPCTLLTESRVRHFHLGYRLGVVGNSGSSHFAWNHRRRKLVVVVVVFAKCIRKLVFMCQQVVSDACCAWPITAIYDSVGSANTSTTNVIVKRE